jgi:hypothetical protein
VHVGTKPKPKPKKPVPKPKPAGEPVIPSFDDTADPVPTPRP